MRQVFSPPDGVLGDAMHPQSSRELQHLSIHPSDGAFVDLVSAPIAPFHDRDRVIRWLHQQAPKKRFQHILGVEALAIQLARHHGVDEQQAAQAGLMHDLAKSFKPSELLDLAHHHQIIVDAVYAVEPHLLHAEIGAIVAQEEFAIQDSEVLAAIRNHTLGSPEMSPLSCIVFLADSLEPGRGNSPELAALRHTSWQDLHQAVWQTCDYTLKFLLDRPTLIHPRAISTRNWALKAAIRKAQKETPPSN